MTSQPTYPDFFRRATGHWPYPFQERLGTEPWPDLLDVPTGLGKTQAVLVAWLWKRLHVPPRAPRRLVYCLPMRVLVEQTAEVAREVVVNLADAFAPPPEVHVLMGGEVDEGFELHPERMSVLIGTQDLLLSRALGRGYAMSRYRWPVHFGLLHSDALWVFDETQLMGVAVETSAQLEGFRRRFGTMFPAGSLWMSATLGSRQLATVDHQPPEDGWRVVRLEAEDEDVEEVRRRREAKKSCQRLEGVVLDKDGAKTYAKEVARRVLVPHGERGGLTLVLVNRVARAQAIYRELERELGDRVGLVHSRFRPQDRRERERLLRSAGDRVVVATQAVEAGVDISARTTVTELAPWPSLVQRLGRLNRQGDDDGLAWWIDLRPGSKDDVALPYDPAEFEIARGLLSALPDASPAALRRVAYEPPTIVRPVIRSRDLLDLFDTSPDLLGNDLDISRWVRDGEDTDVQIYWRDYEGRPEPDIEAPRREELCRVSIGAARDFLDRLAKTARKLRSAGHYDRAAQHQAWSWNALEHRYEPAGRFRPGEMVLLHPVAGGYDPRIGWTGEVAGAVVEPAPGSRSGRPRESMGGDPGSDIGRWVRVVDHLEHVESEARAVTEATALPGRWSPAVVVAARWHDVGKAHEQFQRRLLEPVATRPELAPPGEGPWAKSSHRLKTSGLRPYFRHELASALAWLASREEGTMPGDPGLVDLVAFLIAAHHGKVRLSLRSVAGEHRPTPVDGRGADRPFARGVWDGDELPVIELPGGETVGPLVIDLSPMQMGQGSWLERMLALRDDPDLGPFRLSYLEAILRAADRRASAQEARGREEETDV